MKYDGDQLIGKVPKRLIELSNDFSKRKDGRKSLILLYSVILHQFGVQKKRDKKRKSNKRTFVPIGVNYFKKVVCHEYKKKLNFLIDNKFVRRKKKMVDDHKSGIGLFDDSIWIDDYIIGYKPCSYTILELPKNDDPEVNFEFDFKRNIYTQKVINFLKFIGEDEIRISRDHYGYRLYHNLSNNYKKQLKGKGEFIYYDIKTSIPHQVKLKVQEIDLNDPFIELFNGDFYDNWNTTLNLEFSDRKKIKEHFSKVLYGNKNHYSTEVKNQLNKDFPLFNSLLKKDLGRRMVMNETDLVLNKIVGQCPVDKILTIHDGFIVFKGDQDSIDVFLNEQKISETFSKTELI